MEERPDPAGAQVHRRVLQRRVHGPQAVQDDEHDERGDERRVAEHDRPVPGLNAHLRNTISSEIPRTMPGRASGIARRAGGPLSAEIEPGQDQRERDAHDGADHDGERGDLEAVEDRGVDLAVAEEVPIPPRGDTRERERLRLESLNENTPITTMRRVEDQVDEDDEAQATADPAPFESRVSAGSLTVSPNARPRRRHSKRASVLVKSDTTARKTSEVSRIVTAIAAPNGQLLP